MMRILTIALILVAGTEVTFAADLYRVIIRNQTDADILQAADVRPILVLSDGYLVMAEPEVAAALEKCGTPVRKIASDVAIEDIGLNLADKRTTPVPYPVLFEEDGLTLYKIERSKTAAEVARDYIVPLPTTNIPIKYHRPTIFIDNITGSGINYDSLVGLITTGPIAVRMHQIEDFGYRNSGSAACREVGDWLYDQFVAFGYDSVFVDSFQAYVHTEQWTDTLVWCRNIVACKPGGLYPGRQIIVGAHYDAGLSSPGADDNASGTVGVLELARVLRNIETDMTLIFITFDGEESGLLGSQYYADGAAARGDSIIMMLNMDMIAGQNNVDKACLHYGPQLEYPRLWSKLAYSLESVHLTSTFCGSNDGSDHFPFIQNGYNAFDPKECYSSDHYHLPSDSVVYLDLPYMTRIVRASLATVKYVDVALSPVNMISVRDVGDGQSLEAIWSPADPLQIDHYCLYLGTSPNIWSDSIIVSGDSSRYVVSGLIEDTTYYLYVTWYNKIGQCSIIAEGLSSAPMELPRAPLNVAANAVRNAIRVSWRSRNEELDFSHYAIFRDQALLPDSVRDTIFIDDDPELGTSVHEYVVWAVDRDGNMSDTVGVSPVSARMATLQENHILAVNRSSKKVVRFCQ